VTAMLEGLNEDFRHRFALAVTAIRAELGISVSIVSAFRSRAQQQALYDGWLKRKAGVPGYSHYNLAAPPGNSNHERGLAIDIAPNSTPAMRDVFARFGLHFPVPGEPWHVEPRSARGLSMPPLPGPPPIPPTITEDDEMHGLFLLDAKGVNKGEPVDWIVPPNGPKFATPHRGYIDALRKAGAKTVDLTGQPEVSRAFRDGHP